MQKSMHEISCNVSESDETLILEQVRLGVDVDNPIYGSVEITREQVPIVIVWLQEAERVWTGASPARTS